MTIRRSSVRRYVDIEVFNMLEAAFIERARLLGISIYQLSASVQHDPYQLARAIEDMDWHGELAKPYLDGYRKASTKAYGDVFTNEAKHFAIDMRGGFDKVWLESRGAESVRYINDNTRKAIRESLVRTMDDGLTPMDAAREIESVVDLLPRHAKAVQRRRAMLAGQGMKGQKLRDATKQYGQKLLKYRARNIARYELLSAGAQSQLDSWALGMNQGVIPTSAKKLWILTPDDKLCPICASLGGQKVPIWGMFVSEFGSFSRPAAHGSCRCAIGLDYGS